jgi:hypothetical protein
MRSFRTAIGVIIRRPFIIIFSAAVALVYCAVSSINPVVPILLGLGRVTGGNAFESVISFLQILFEPGVILPGLLFIFCFAVAAGLVAGLLLPGYMSVIRNSLEGAGESGKEFTLGLKKYFLKIWLISSRVIFLSAIFIIFMLVSSVPAIIITRSALTDKPDFLLAAIFVDVLTAGVVLFSSMFFRAYMLFWYTAAYDPLKRPFLRAKRFVDENFWGIMGSLLVFDAVFLAFQLLRSLIGSPILAFAAEWIFTAAYASMLTTFVFTYYKVRR